MKYPFGQGTPSTDGKGHGDQARVQFPPAMLHAARTLAQGEKWPHYQTAQDVVRDGLFRLIHEIAEADPEMDDAYKMMMVENAQLKRGQRQEFFAKVVERFGQQFAYAKDAIEVKEILEELETVLSMPMSAGIRMQLEELQRRWG